MAVRAEWVEKDLYAVLGVAEDADAKAITRAYRKLARDLHPDTHPDDAEAAERFKEVTAAYDVVGDAAKRAEYDEFRRAVAAGANFGPGAGRRSTGSPFESGDDGTWTWFRSGGDDASSWEGFEATGWTSVEDLLGSVMGRQGARGDVPRQGVDLEAVLNLGFEDAVRGVTTEVTLQDSNGMRTFKVRVPAGVEDGQRIRLAGKGGPGSNGGPPGDLYAVVAVAPHPVFGRTGRDLTVSVSIGWPQAVLGTEVEVPTLDGSTVRVRVPAGTPHGRVLRVRGRGVISPTGNGDLLVGVRVTVPDHLSDEQRQAVEAVARAFEAA